MSSSLQSKSNTAAAVKMTMGNCHRLVYLIFGKITPWLYAKKKSIKKSNLLPIIHPGGFALDTKGIVPCQTLRNLL